MDDDREALGRVAHEAEVAFWAEQGVTIYPWEAWEQKELAMRVASAVAARAVKDARLEDTRMRAQLLVFGEHLPAALDALVYAVTNLEGKAPVKRFRAALKAWGGEEP